jgi:hypothetical protein
MPVNQADIHRDEKADPVVGVRLEERDRVMAGKKTAPSIGKAVADLWRTVTTDLFGTYHPERHYMRGPGPKWRAKHARPAVSEPDLGGKANASA